MTGADMAKIIGREGSLLVSEGFDVEVIITNVKVSYGSLRYEVLPIRGANTGWVDASRVKLGHEPAQGLGARIESVLL